MSIENSHCRVSINENCFDIIRLICTFTVFLGHFLNHFSVNNDFLHSLAFFVRGVPVFFFLSGLFIARSLEKYQIGEYLKRRAVRIFPELWVCVLFNLLLILVSFKPTLKDIIVYIGTQMTVFQFYTGDWLRGYGVGVPNGALWTITVDIQFYIAAIFLAKWMKMRTARVWRIVIIVAMTIDLLLEKGKSFFPEIVYKLLQCNLLPFVWIFLVGMYVYYNRDRVIPILVKYKWGFAVAYLTWQYFVPESVIKIFGGIRYNLITTLLMLLSISGIGFSFHKRLKQDYSYSFYLYHMVVINYIYNNICREFNSSGQFILSLMISVLVIGLLAILSHRYIAESLTSKIEKKLL